MGVPITKSAIDACVAPSLESATGIRIEPFLHPEEVVLFCHQDTRSSPQGLSSHLRWGSVLDVNLQHGFPRRIWSGLRKRPAKRAVGPEGWTFQSCSDTECANARIREQLAE